MKALAVLLFCCLVNLKLWASAQTCANTTTTCTPPNCITLRGKTYTRFYTCNATTHTLIGTVAEIQALARGASQVLITRPDGTYAVSNPNSYPIRRLRNGTTLSFDTSPPSQDIYPLASEISKSWQGNATLRNLALGSACSTQGGQPQSIDQRLFWGCNSSGLQILADQQLCSWNASQYEGVINVYADFDINSCLAYPCDCNATCRDLAEPGINARSNRQCLCNQGFGGNGETCTACSVNATWTNGTFTGGNGGNNGGNGGGWDNGNYGGGRRGRGGRGGRHLLGWDGGSGGSGRNSQCRCNTGFIGNGSVCTEVNACQLRPCKSGANCTLAANATYGRTCNCSCGTYDERYGCLRATPSINLTATVQTSTTVLLSARVNGSCTTPTGTCSFYFRRSSTRRVALVNGVCNATISARDWASNEQCAEVIYSGDAKYQERSVQITNRKPSGW